MAKPVVGTAENFKSLVIDSEKVSIIDFWAPWCGYCVRMAPVFEALAEEMGAEVNFVKVNTDEQMELARMFRIEVLPTFVIVKNGEIVDRKVGYLAKEDLAEAVKAVL